MRRARARESVCREVGRRHDNIPELADKAGRVDQVLRVHEHLRGPVHGTEVRIEQGHLHLLVVREARQALGEARPKTVHRVWHEQWFLCVFTVVVVTVVVWNATNLPHARSHSP